jgi:hypothetical protein
MNQTDLQHNGSDLKEFPGLVVNEQPFRFKPREWWIHGVLQKDPRGTEIFAAPKQGKGLLVIHMLLCLLNGLPFGGIEVEKAKRAIYFDAEDGLDEFARRVTRLAAGMQVAVPAPDQLRYVRLHRNLFAAIKGDDSDEQGARVRKTILAFEPDVIVVDALQSICGGNQNLAEVGGGAWDWWSGLAAESRSALVIIDHSGWGKSHAGGTIHKLGRAAESLQVVKRDGKQEDAFTAWQVLDLTGQDANYRVMMPGGAPLLSVKYDFLSTPAVRPEDEGKPDVGPIVASVVDPPAPRETIIAHVVAALEQEYPRQLDGGALADALGLDPTSKPEVRKIQAAISSHGELVISDGKRPAHYRLANRGYGLISAEAPKEQA